jgi:hypothetical protein
MRQRSVRRSAIGAFRNRSQLLDEAKFANVLRAVIATNTHIPQRKTLNGSPNVQYPVRPRTTTAPTTSSIAAIILAAENPAVRSV